jgi:hypothetical protein
MPSPRIHEETLRRLWFEHCRDAAGLHTTSGLPVEVVHPGNPNHDGGPDFLDAIVRIGGVRYSGDVEIHVRSSAWITHRHGDDPHYNRVVLHAAWVNDVRGGPACTRSGRSVPLLLLSPLVNIPTGVQSPEIIMPGQFLKRAPLPCYDAWRDATDATILARLEGLGEERMVLRCGVLRDRLRERLAERWRESHAPESGGGSPAAWTSIWEELLYEGLFEAMGYGKNSRPFLALSRSIRLSSLRRFDMGDRTTIQAVLFGAAGLLPPPNGLPAKESRDRVRLLRRRWKELRPFFRVPLLHEAEWLFFRLRPANFPTARLALCAHLLPALFAPGSVEALFSTLRRSGNAGSLAEIRKHLPCDPDEYWSCFLHFRQVHPNRGISLGPQRFRDFFLNTIAPLAWIRGRLEDDDALAAASLRMIRRLPAPPMNASTRPVLEDILGRRRFASALQDQGALALAKNWCRSGRCRECPLKSSAVRSGLPS